MDSKSFQAAFYLFALILSLCATSSAQTCNSYSFSTNEKFSHCVDLPVLNAFLHWHYDAINGSTRIAFRINNVSPSDWVCWGLNPRGRRMVGTQAIVAYQNSSGGFTAYTSTVTSYSTQLPRGSLTFDVSRMQASLKGGEAIIFATLQLPSQLVSTNQVWQIGPMSGGIPLSHRTSGPYMRSTGRIDFQTGQAATVGGSSSEQNQKNTHGLLNAVGWGILMPLGVIMARHVKVFSSPAWFYLHIACQGTGYVIGVAGWATGIELGSDSPAVYSTHRNIGIILFVFGTLQVFALLLRPKPDHKYRLYWTIYHRGLGYATIILSVINIYEGLEILEPGDQWERAYSGALILIGACGLVLEAVTWTVQLKRKNDTDARRKYSDHGSAIGMTNGHGSSEHMT